MRLKKLTSDLRERSGESEDAHGDQTRAPRRSRRADERSRSRSTSPQIDQEAQSLRRAARAAGVELSASFARRAAAAGIEREPHVGLSQLGSGVVIHTLPRTAKRLPVVVGYADERGQWYADGRRHVERPDRDSSAAEIGQVAK